MAVHLFDPVRHELTLCDGPTIFVRPSSMGHWPRASVRLPIIAKRWALKQGYINEDDHVATLEFQDTPEPA